MMYSFRIEQAIRAAAVLHKDQMRKGSAPFPYVTHPFSVACIAADYTDDEDTIISALLHDTLEDTDYTSEELEMDFGRNVREIVESVTAYHIPNDKRTWLETRDDYLDNIEKAPKGGLIVSAADKLHNMRSIIEEYQHSIMDYLTDFGGSLEDRLVFYQKLSNILNRKLDNDIIHEFNHVFTEYKTFVNQETDN